MYSVNQQEDDHKGSFFIEEGGKKVAEMTYSKAGSDRIIIDHTDVAASHRGKNAGKQLVLKAVAYARNKGISIIPLCPFARSVFEKNPELRDVL